MWFNNGGAIEFGQAMLQAGKLGKYFIYITIHMDRMCRNAQIILETCYFSMRL